MSYDDYDDYECPCSFCGNPGLMVRQRACCPEKGGGLQDDYNHASSRERAPAVSYKSFGERNDPRWGAKRSARQAKEAFKNECESENWINLGNVQHAHAAASDARVRWAEAVTDLLSWMLSE